MALIKFSAHDILSERLRPVLNRLVECDVCDPDVVFPELRGCARAELREIESQAVTAGLRFPELYNYVIVTEEGSADFAAFG